MESGENFCFVLRFNVEVKGLAIFMKATKTEIRIFRMKYFNPKSSQLSKVSIKAKTKAVARIKTLPAPKLKTFQVANITRTGSRF